MGDKTNISLAGATASSIAKQEAALNPLLSADVILHYKRVSQVPNPSSVSIENLQTGHNVALVLRYLNDTFN